MSTGGGELFSPVGAGEGLRRLEKILRSVSTMFSDGSLIGGKTAQNRTKETGSG